MDTAYCIYVPNFVIVEFPLRIKSQSKLILKMSSTQITAAWTRLIMDCSTLSNVYAHKNISWLNVPSCSIAAEYIWDF